MDSSGRAAAFRERARAEARRYGSDPWVFVRELLQNARDAGASRVNLEVTNHDDVQRLSCRDNGDGMDLSEAQRFLFTLYASSKETVSARAGHFGVGFWSVLRFEPSRIVIRSQPVEGAGWEIAVDGDLGRVEQRAHRSEPGTEVVLERPPRGDPLTRSVVHAAWSYGRFLTRRGGAGEELVVEVNGRRVNAAFGLPAPSITFARSGLRGAVALGDEPLVELHAFGLKVRDAPYLHDLTDRAASPSAVADGMLGEGVFPRILLDSDRLQVMMARSDARDDRELERLVSLAQQELARLVRWHLDQHAPSSLPRRAVDHVRRWLGPRWTRRGVAVVLAGALIGVAVGAILSRLAPSPSSAPASNRAQAYADPFLDYKGPAVSPIGGQLLGLDLSYSPDDADHLFAVHRMRGLADDGTAASPTGATATPAGSSPDCSTGCIQVDLRVDADAGLLRLPVPTGHAVVGGVANLDSQVFPVLVTTDGDSAFRLTARLEGVIRYRTAAMSASRTPPGRWPRLPEELDRLTGKLIQLPVEERIAAARAAIMERLAYDRSPDTARRHLQARQQGLPFVDGTLSVGAGDCDVLNAVLAAVLDHAGVPSRLALGLVGHHGRAAPGLHAWVEALDATGRWRVVDASSRSAALPEVPALAPATATSEGDPEAVGAATWGATAVLAAIGVCAATVGLLVLVVLVLRHRTTRTTASGNGADLGQLLGGALRQPAAYAQVRELDTRPVVPVLRGRELSLARARRLAARARLYSGSADGSLADRAARSGVAVIDTGQEAGRVVAELLGARDLDSWEILLGRSTSTPWTEAVERALGTPWRVRAASDVGDRVATLEVEPLRVHAVVMDSGSELVTHATRLAARQPALASLAVADAMIHHVGLPTHHRRRLLAELSRRALAEEAAR